MTSVEGAVELVRLQGFKKQKNKFMGTLDVRHRCRADLGGFDTVLENLHDKLHVPKRKNSSFAIAPATGSFRTIFAPWSNLSPQLWTCQGRSKPGVKDIDYLPEGFESDWGKHWIAVAHAIIPSKSIFLLMSPGRR
jgi:hypothetical protein